MNILVVEDNVDILASVVEYLTLKGFSVDAIHNGRGALDLINQEQYDLVVLDIGLPGFDGYSLCQYLREQEHNYIPIIMLTARDTLDDRLKGLRAGADDYLVKPFALAELYERIKTVLKRCQQQQMRSLSIAGLEVNLDSRIVIRDGQVLDINPKCFALLRLLMKRWPAVVTHAQLCRAIWGDDAPDSNALKTHIYRLRQKVDQPFDTSMIAAVPSVGYKIVTNE